MLLQPTSLYVEGLFNALKEDNKSLKFKAGKSWSTDVRTQTIEYNADDLKKFSFNEIKGLVLHETGHLLHTRETKPTELEQKYPAMHTIYNAFEDIRIEKKMINQYDQFARQGIQAINNSMIQTIAEKLKIDNKQVPDLAQALIGMTSTLSYDNRQMTDSDALLNTRYATKPEVNEKVRDALRSGLPSFGSLKSTDDVKKMVDEYIYPHIKEYLKENEQPQPLDGQCSIKGETRGGRGKGDKDPISQSNLPSDTELEWLLSPYINTLARKLQNVLKERAQVKYYGNHKSGRLLARNAYKVLIPNESRIFSKRNVPDLPHYSITLLLDESGSMTEVRNEMTKHATTYIASFLLYRACKKINFDFNIIGYEDEPIVYDKLSNYRRMRGGGNNEQLALQEAYKLLNKNDDNLVFLLTDGLACSSPTEIHTEINRLKKDKNADTIAVGVELSKGELSVISEYYPRWINAPKSDELPQVLISLISGIIHR